jgi:hypothetical protein
MCNPEEAAESDWRCDDGKGNGGKRRQMEFDALCASLETFTRTTNRKIAQNPNWLLIGQISYLH